MVAFTYRMGAGFPGDVNRTHPASITTELTGTAAPTAYGQAVIADTNGAMRPFTTGDAAQNAWGVTVRAFPVQQSTTSNAYGAAGFGSVTPPAGTIDVLRSGFIIVNLPNGGTTVKGGAVYVRVAASSGNHVIGAFEAASDSTNTVLVQNATFNGAPDASGNVEIGFAI